MEDVQQGGETGRSSGQLTTSGRGASAGGGVDSGAGGSSVGRASGNTAGVAGSVPGAAAALKGMGAKAGGVGKKTGLGLFEEIKEEEDPEKDVVAFEIDPVQVRGRIRHCSTCFGRFLFFAV